LTENVFHPELNVRELTGFKGNYRVVVLSDYRMIFSFDLKNIYLLRIANRKDIYRNKVWTPVAKLKFGLLLPN